MSSNEPIIDHAFKAMEALRELDEITAPLEPVPPATVATMRTVDFNRVQYLSGAIAAHAQLAQRDAINAQTRATKEQSELMATALSEQMTPAQAKNFLAVITGRLEVK